MLFRPGMEAHAPEQRRPFSAGAAEALGFGNLVDLRFGERCAYCGHRLLRSIGELRWLALAALRRWDDEVRHAQKTESKAVKAHRVHRMSSYRQYPPQPCFTPSATEVWSEG